MLVAVTSIAGSNERDAALLTGRENTLAGSGELAESNCDGSGGEGSVEMIAYVRAFAGREVGGTPAHPFPNSPYLRGK